MALSWLKGKVEEVSRGLKAEVTKIQSQSFLEGVIGGCTLVAYADGIVRPEEKQKMMGFLRSNDALSLFDTGKVIELFDKCCAKFEFDRGIGQMECLALVGKLKAKPNEARLLVRVCCAVAESDGHFDQTERETVRSICRELGLDPAEFESAK